MGTLSVNYARKRLLIIALIGAGVVFAILLLQTLSSNKHNGTEVALWTRYFILWLPLLLALIGLMWYPAPGHRADQRLFLTSRILLWLYTLAHWGLIIIQPLLPAVEEGDFSLLAWVRTTSYFFLPVELLLIVLILLLVLKPADSASETLEELPEEEQKRIRDAFREEAAEVRPMIGQNRVEEAIERLLAFCVEYDLPQDELLQLQRRWNDNKRERNKNLISNEEANREEARITEALLDGIKEMV